MPASGSQQDTAKDRYCVDTAGAQDARRRSRPSSGERQRRGHIEIDSRPVGWQGRLPPQRCVTAPTEKGFAPMSSSMNQQTVVERIDLYLTDDMPVYDSNSEEIGHVKMFSTVAGYLIVGHGPFEKDNLYIPFRLIQSIDPRELFLSEPKQTVIAGYTTPPQISTFTEQRLVRTAEGGVKSESRQVQMVRSGYDGLPARINSVDIADSAQRLAVGMAVYDASGARLGDVSQYDTARSLFSVESRHLQATGAVRALQRHSEHRRRGLYGSSRASTRCHREGTRHASSGCLVAARKSLAVSFRPAQELSSRPESGLCKRGTTGSARRQSPRTLDTILV